MRIEWVKLRLHNWALWKARDAGGGRGFATQSVLLREPASGYRESIMPIDDTDAGVTNVAIEALRLTRPHLVDVLECIYLHDTGLKGAAQRLCRAQSSISSSLDAADRALRDWFVARDEKKKSLST